MACDTFSVASALHFLSSMAGVARKLGTARESSMIASSKRLRGIKRRSRSASMANRAAAHAFRLGLLGK